MKENKISRRSFLRVMGLGFGAAMLTACKTGTTDSPADSPAASVPDADTPVPFLTEDEFPRLDGSTACIPLMAQMKADVTGMDLLEAQTSITVSTTAYAWENFGLWSRSASDDYGAQLLIVYEAPEYVKEELAEADAKLEQKAIGRDALVFIVNEDNPVQALTRQQLRDIYAGKITNWKQVGGDDRKIVVYSRETSSGTYEFFKESVLKNKNYMSEVFDYILECLQKLLPEFKIANAVIHFDEASPHMHVVGIPVWEGAKRGLSKKVSKRNVFTPQTLSVILQDKLRAEASYGFECYFKEQLAEKKKGRNHDLSVTEYKVAQESRKLTDIKQQNNEEQEKNTKLRSNNASISYQIATQEQRHSRNLDVIAADEDRLETVRSSINAAETEYAKYADMIMDKKNNLELLSSKESELIERTKIAESVFDMFRQSGTDDVREKLIDVMYENQKLREENTTLKELLEKAYEFMKQFVIDGVNLLERFLESVGKVVGKIR